MAASYDSLYKKDIQSFRVDKGAVRELRYKIPFGSSIVVRVSSDEPVILTMAGPHIEETEIVGIKEFRFTSNPGNELVIKFQGKSGFFVKPSNVTLEVEMYTSRDVVKMADEVTNLLGVLKELGKDYYVLNKEYVQDVLRRIAGVWNQLDDETKTKVKDLMTIAKRFEEGGT